MTRYVVAERDAQESATWSALALVVTAVRGTHGTHGTHGARGAYDTRDTRGVPAAPAATGSEVDGHGSAVREILTALTALRQLHDQLNEWEPELIAAARAAGANWAQLAPALGVASRQAAERRYLRLRRSEHDTAGITGEQRVEAERDRRAGQRAINDWARVHSADLRQLAGQVTALTDLGPEAQASLDRLHLALGSSDPAVLVPLLTAAHGYLPEQHAAFADRITAVTEHADQIRRSARQRRGRARRPDAAQAEEPGRAGTGSAS